MPLIDQVTDFLIRFAPISELPSYWRFHGLDKLVNLYSVKIEEEKNTQRGF